MKSSRTSRSTRSSRHCSMPVMSIPVSPSGSEPIRGATAPAVSVAVDGSMRDLLIEHPKDLSDRIHFLGAQSDADFLRRMAICDAVVFPYLEVGQSSSGPISQALELGCRVIASRTHTFLQLGRYHHEHDRVLRHRQPPRIGRPHPSAPAIRARASICRHSTSRPTRRSISPPMAACPKAVDRRTALLAEPSRFGHQLVQIAATTIAIPANLSIDSHALAIL